MSRFLLAIAALFALAAPAAAQTAYLQLLEDVPLPQSFREAPDSAMFEAPEGRIVQASASGRGGVEAARRFYLDALPALGWSNAPETEGPLVFNRGREQLLIAISEAQAAAPGLVSVQFRLVSRSASMAPD